MALLHQANSLSIYLEMAALFARLTKRGAVAGISGGDWPQFETQLICKLPQITNLSRLFILPTSGTKLYRYDGDWRVIYKEAMGPTERRQVIRALEKVISTLGLNSERRWGASIEDRASQITFSALGQQAPVNAKSGWDIDQAKRKQI
jgi:phosphomannomutase